MYYTQEQIDRANQADIVSFLQSQGEQLTRAGNEYRWKRHDSLTVRGNKWYRHSQSKGGAPIDFVMEFFGKSFTEAVELLTGEKGAAPPPDRPSPASFSDFRLPPRSPDNRIARNYLTAARRIDEDVSGFFFARGDIYEDAAHHNAVFVGRDEDGIPRYAHQRGTTGSFRLDVKGSDKAFNFCYRGEGERLFVFEAPVDLLSFLCLFKKEWQKQSYLALGGVGEKALLRFLSDRPNIKTVYLCLDSDQAGNDACSRLAELVPEGLTVHRLIPLFKDWNEVQTRRGEITDGKYLREAVYGLKEPPQEETVEIIRMSDVDTQTVEWLWEPYIPFGKVTIVQGNPGEGKTTFALRLAAACTTGGTLPGMKPLPPFQVIYQTAEDGLGDTVKPRLIEAAADLDRVLVIDEAKQELRGRDLLLCQIYGDLVTVLPTDKQTENQTDNLGGFLVDYPKILVVRVFDIAVRGFGDNRLSTHAFGLNARFHFLADVLCVPLRHDVDKGRKLQCVGLLAVYPVVDRDKTHIVPSEYLHRVADLEIVTPPAGKVFHNADTDFPVFHIVHHAGVGGTVKKPAAFVIVDVVPDIG